MYVNMGTRGQEKTVSNPLKLELVICDLSVGTVIQIQVVITEQQVLSMAEPPLQPTLL